MNIYITYRNQYGLAKNAKEAVKIIEDFFNPDLDEYIICNNNIKKWIDVIIGSKMNKQVDVWTTNSGYNRKIHLIPTEHNEIEPILEDIEKEKHIRKANEANELEQDRKAYLTQLNTVQNGIYHVKLRFSYKDEEGNIYGDEIEDDVNAYSGYNAYMKMTDYAVDLCRMRGHKFIKPKSLFAKSTIINYIGK